MTQENPPIDENGLPAYPDSKLLTDPAICSLREPPMSPRTLHRLRERNGFPQPTIIINGVKSTTWLYIKQWLLAQPKKSQMRGWDAAA